MIISTTDKIAGYVISEHVGLVVGNTIRARHIGKDISAMLRTIVGGEIPEYTTMMAESREQALQRMLENAKELQADAIIAVRFQTSMIMQSTAELLVYGTAVKIKKQ